MSRVLASVLFLVVPFLTIGLVVNDHQISVVNQKLEEMKAAATMPVPSAQQAAAPVCASIVGCELEWDRVLVDEMSTPDPHLYILKGVDGGGFTLSLVNTAVDLRLYVYGPAGEDLGVVSSRDGTAELSVPGIEGLYAIYVDTPFGRVSKTPYAVKAMRHPMTQS